MSEIIKTEAIVLSKMDYRESSKIATFYTKDHGKLSAIIKGARSKKSPVGVKIDLFNYLQLVVYKRNNRDLQLVTQVELTSYFPEIKTDLQKLKYATAVLELIQALTVEEDVNPRLFKGVVRILELFNTSDEEPGVLLVKFILFLLKEIGYEIRLDHCSVCNNPLPTGRLPLYTFDRGIICDDCSKNSLQSSIFPKELFNLMIGLRNNKNVTIQDKREVDNILFFLEQYIKYHVADFKGIRSIHLY
ncbi:MAG: DNA repair protein RecO [Bacteroidota bacterium]|nr:DNA repair protein RecO [Bacteroidota bacterium]MDP4193598.1 DNA repair protein RecO [Bacteroidota bacterium]